MLLKIVFSVFIISFSPEICWIISFKLETPKTLISSITAASAAFSRGTKRFLIPFSRAVMAMVKTPFTARILPSRAISPTIILSLKSNLICSEAFKIASKIGRSYIEPSFFVLAGARLTVILPVGNLYPQFLIAARTRSRDSFTVASGSPTISKFGSPPETSASISIIYEFKPNSPMLLILENILHS